MENMRQNSGFGVIKQELNEGGGGEAAARKEFRLAWRWVEGRRAKLGVSWDIVEKETNVWSIVKNLREHLRNSTESKANT